MIIVLKEMIEESAVFFLLLIVIGAGFVQSFFGLDSTDGENMTMNTVLHKLVQAVLDEPDFEYFQNISPPFGHLLFYLFNFIVTIRASLCDP
jgi:hypothetical protein